jgi:flagellar motility protein MotE (MotC chaperone)
MIKMLTSTWMTVLLSSVIYLGSMVAFWKTPVMARGERDHVLTVEESAVGPSWEFSNPEADQLVAELRMEKVALTKRAQDLNDLSQRLDAERAELNLVTQTVHDMQTNFDQTVVRVKLDETANLKKLAKTYLAMSPDVTANVFKEMDDAAIVKLLMFMKEDEKGPILEAMAKKGPAEAKHVALLGERLRTSIQDKPAAQ